MRVLITGGRTGYLGRRVVAAAGEHDVIALGSADADVRDRRAIQEVVARHAPDTIIHTAYVQSDWDVTAGGAVNVALAAAGCGSRLVLVSSDVVFSGKDGLYQESDSPDPITPYGAAKAAAETAARAVCDDTVVARTSLILGDGASQHERLVHALAAGGDGGLFEDERRCPVHVDDLAAALVELATTDYRGILHCAGADAISRYELGRAIARRDGVDGDALRPTRRAELAVPGPIDVRLDSSAAAGLLTTRLRGAREFLGS